MAITKSRIYTAVASAERTETGDSGAIGVVENFDEMLVILNVEAASAGTLDVAYQVSGDGGTTWVTHTAFSQITSATGAVALKLENIGTVGRIAYTLGSTPTYTFSVILVCKRRG